MYNEQGEESFYRQESEINNRPLAADPALSTGQSSYQYQAAPKEAPKKKKTGSKVMGLILAGLLFGSCAAFAFVVILRLFPTDHYSDDPREEKGEVEIEEADVTLPDNHTGDAAEEQAEPEEAKEEIAGEEEAGDEKEEGQESLAVVTDVTKVVDEVMPAVVSIFGVYEVTENYWGFEMQREQDGSGSGIIVGKNEEELLIVTNNHVVADSTSLTVQFIDNEKYNAVVKGTDADSDLAVVAIQMTEIKDATKARIKIAQLGDSDALKVGEPAIAIGNALGYGQSVTTGVISAVNRKYSQDEKGNDAFLIQTDAAINPGNSGGALLNIYGEVIGINSSKIGGMVVEGMGYAIPISTAKPILEQLMSKKTRAPVEENKKGYLGISGINVTEDVKTTYGLPIGVYIAQVFDGTPAQKAGLRKGDVIVSFDGDQVETMEELTNLLDVTMAGTNVELVIMRTDDGNTYEEETIEVVLGAQY
ncbi:MAG: trypsin-like peptidase domain-containing protein [Lachnospiraceae bacterium]|nr:trypsin-like peptidase domain-containing protein [Lachnospiraceae bacterium]